MIQTDNKTSNEEDNDMLNQKFSTRKYKLIYLLASSLVVAFFSHLFFLSEWFDGRYMAGVGDGLSQMLPFKQLLYKEYTNGSFFYSSEFGLGGGIYAQLGYYFSTSIVFILTVIITSCLEAMHLIKEPDLFYWGNIILVISIIRMTCIIWFTTFYFRYIKFQSIPAFIGATLYGTSVIYFRHVTYWEFFADAMLFLPLWLLGIEKIIREKKAGWFLVAVALSLINNFYFSYIHFWAAGLYIVFRWLIPLAEKETGKVQQVKLFVWSVLAAFGLSAFSFIPVISGYLNNYRPSYDEKVPVYAFTDNLLMHGKIIILPTFFILCLFVLCFYKERLFRFFACLTILLFLLHFSPFIASMFNGFSAPQYRWEYFLALTGGGVAAAGLQQIHKIKKWEVGVSLAGTTALYVLLYLKDPDLSFSILLESYEMYSAVAIILLFGLYGWKKQKWIRTGLLVGVVIVSLYTANQYQDKMLFNKGKVKDASKAFMVSEDYNGKDQQELIKKIQERERDPFARIDWMIDMRNNTPLVQNFKGFSIYSSILNKQLLFFYLFDLEIDMGRESVSRYGSLGDRANLYSILNGKYYIAEKGKTAIPYGFEKILTIGNYVAYENKNSLPSIRTTEKVFFENEFLHASPLAKEKAMLEGVILKEGTTQEKKIPESENTMNHVQVKAVGASYQDEILQVTDKEGGLNLLIDQGSSTAKDYYLSFYLKSMEDKKADEYKLTVNDYETTRKSNHSIYKTNVNEITVRIKKTDEIMIRVPKGKYHIANFKLYEEDYHLLEAVKKENDKKANVPATFSKNRVAISYDNKTNQQYMILPIPFEKGWKVYVNGKKQKVLQANYAFTGIKLQKGLNEMEMVYYPPYFWSSVLITLSTLVILLFVFRRKKAF
ncbi:MAG: YfhO family protein [Bacillus sp. (in: firmicutes)]